MGGDPCCCELLLHEHAAVCCKDENGWHEIHQVRGRLPISLEAQLPLSCYPRAGLASPQVRSGLPVLCVTCAEFLKYLNGSPAFKNGDIYPETDISDFSGEIGRLCISGWLQLTGVVGRMALGP